MPHIPRVATFCATLLFAVLTVGCGDSGTKSATGTPTTPTATAKPSDTGAAQKLYVINSGGGTNADTVLAFSPTANGTVAPLQTIAASGTSTTFAGLDVDGANNIYVSARTSSGTSTTGAINIYNASSTGAATPTRTFAPANTSGSAITFPGALSVDRTGNIFVNSEALELAYAPSTATGSVNASFQLTGGNSQLYFPSGTWVDANNNLYVAQTFSTTGNPQGILVFNSGVAATSAPARTIVGSLIGLTSVSAVTADKSGNIYAAGTSNGVPEIVMYPPTANGNVAGAKYILGSNTRLLDPRGIAVDGAGTIYVLTSPRSKPLILSFSAASLAGCTQCNVAPTTAFESTALPNAQGTLAIY